MDSRDDAHELALALAKHQRVDPPHAHCTCDPHGEEVVRLGELFSKHLVDVVLDAGWMPADQAGALFEGVRAERDVLAATVERVHRLCDGPPMHPKAPLYVRISAVRAALDGPGEEDG